MPIYEYRCTSCGRTVEVLQRFDDPPATECSQCHGSLEKLFSAPSFHFKGSGWYVNDYGKGGGAKASDGEGSSATKESSGTDSAAKSSEPKSSETKASSDSTATSSAT